MSFRRQLKTTFKDVFGGLGSDKEEKKSKKDKRDKDSGKKSKTGGLVDGGISEPVTASQSSSSSKLSQSQKSIVREEGDGARKLGPSDSIRDEGILSSSTRDGNSSTSKPPRRDRETSESGKRDQQRPPLSSAHPPRDGEENSYVTAGITNVLTGFSAHNLHTSKDPDGPWEQALALLTVEERIELLHNPKSSSSHPPDEQAVISAILRQSQELLEASEKRAWTIKNPLTGELMPFKQKLHKFLNRVNTYATLGDIAVQHSPEITALVWGGVRFLMKLIINDGETWGQVVETMDAIAGALGRCRIYEKLYLGEGYEGNRYADGEVLDGGKRVTDALVGFYASMLKFAVRSKRYFKRGNRKRIAMEAIKPFEVEFEPILDEMKRNEERVEREARAAGDELSAKERMEVRKRDAAQAATLSQLQSLLTDLSTVHITSLNLQLTQTHAEVQRIRKAQEEEERLAILQWLSQVKYLDNHKTTKSVRQDGTGGWLFERKEWKEWLGIPRDQKLEEEDEEEEDWLDLEAKPKVVDLKKEEENEAKGLWLHGLPGTGKTVLTSNVIDHLATISKPAFPSAPSPSTLVSYFYCSYTEAPRRQAITLLAAILKQLSINLNPSPDNDPTGLGLPKSLVMSYRSHKEQGFSAAQLDLEEMEEIIHNEILPSSGLKRVYIVIDALDEMEEKSRKELFPILAKLLSYQGGCKVKIFVASRGGMRDIKMAFEKEEGCWAKMGLAKEDTGGDIKAFVEASVEQALESGELLEGDMEEELKVEVIQTLIRGAEGMFLWVRYQIAHICEQETEYDLSEALKNLPRGIEETYTLLLGKINAQPPNRKRLAERVLKWMLCAARPLTPRELAEAVAIEPSTDKELNAKKLVKGVEAIVGICGNFIAYDEQLGVLRFVHFSVQEFLEKRFSTVEEANSLVAEVCITLLCFDKAWKLWVKEDGDENDAKRQKKADEKSDVITAAEGSENDSEKPQQIIDNRIPLGLAEYVVLKWGHHAKVATSSCDVASEPAETLFNLIYKFFNTSENSYFDNWFNFFRTIDYTFHIHLLEPKVDNIRPNPLIIALHFGLLPIAIHLSTTLPTLYSPTSTLPNTRSWTPLHFAAATALHHIIPLLITDLSASPNPLDDDSRTPLHILASSRRAPNFLSHPEALTTKTLLAHGANPLLTCRSSHSTPLHLASLYGNLSVIRALCIYAHETHYLSNPHVTAIDKQKDIFGKTPLHVAATSRWLQVNAKAEVIMHLVCFGHNINARDSFNRTAVVGALIECPMGALTIGQFLIDLGCEWEFPTPGKPPPRPKPGVPTMVLGKNVEFVKWEGMRRNAGVWLMWSPSVTQWRIFGQRRFGIGMALGDSGFRARCRGWCEGDGRVAR